MPDKKGYLDKINNVATTYTNYLKIILSKSFYKRHIEAMKKNINTKFLEK